MHLLVLSAFRLGWEGPGDALLMRVSMHLLVLSAFRLGSVFMSWESGLSQCTFWCSVLSVLPGHAGRRLSTPSLNAPSGAQCFPS